MYNFVLYANIALWVVVLLIAVALLPKDNTAELSETDTTAPAPTPVEEIKPLEEPTTAQDNTTYQP